MRREDESAGIMLDWQEWKGSCPPCHNIWVLNENRGDLLPFPDILSFHCFTSEGGGVDGEGKTISDWIASSLSARHTRPFEYRWGEGRGKGEAWKRDPVSKGSLV